MNAIGNNLLESTLFFGEYKNFVPMNNGESHIDFQKRIEPGQFYFSKLSGGKMFLLITKHEIAKYLIEDVIDLFWKALGEVCVNEQEETEERFLHFEAYTDVHDIWHWFEEYFDISIGERYF
jgi:hypothetical protein